MKEDLLFLIIKSDFILLELGSLKKSVDSLGKLEL